MIISRRPPPQNSYPEKMRVFAVSFSLILYFFIICVRAQSSSSNVNNGTTQCKAWVVQSIPTDMPHLSLVPGVLSTADVFRWLAGNSSRSLDIITQVWQLIAHPEDPRSGDYGYSKDEMKKFGANDGLEVYRALENAADRNISMRLLQHSGAYPDYTEEAFRLAFGRPNVQSVTLLLKDWTESGFIHAKVWISDRRHVYIGSANNDWKSLNQVKEVGIYLVDCPRIAKKVETYYDNLWKLAHLDPSNYTKLVSDHQWQTVRKVPCWSQFLRKRDRCKSPLPKYVKIKHVTGYPTLVDPDMYYLPIETPGRSYSTPQPQSPSYLSFSPPELLFDKHQSDEQAWIDTIKSVGEGETVRISTMDWLGQSQYTSRTVYWSSISSAISQVVYSKQAKVKLLVAYGPHFINSPAQYLKSLLNTNNLCSFSSNEFCGEVEIKYYLVPGFNLTGPSKLQNGSATTNVYPGYSRVNQAKYAVSDVRAHIGTNNIVWDFFYTTSGISFGTYNLGVVSQLQQVFDADWSSPYAVAVDALEQGRAHVYSS